MVNSIIVDPEMETLESVEDTTSDMGTGAIETTEEEQTQSEYELPSKFQGKSVEDIVNSYSELEKELGRKGQEIGELRKLSDEFLKTQIQANQQNVQEQEEETDFFEDPQAAIRREIENHPKFKEAEKQTQQRQQEATVQSLNQQHPDAQQVVESKEFQEWVSQSKIRVRLFEEANAYDLDAANELLSNWKERKLISNTREEQSNQKESKAKALKSGKAESRSSGESIGGKKIYRRSDLIRLKQTDPMRYDALADEIYQAYAEGRVK
jgi:hypothetical protein